MDKATLEILETLVGYAGGCTLVPPRKEHVAIGTRAVNAAIKLKATGLVVTERHPSVRGALIVKLSYQESVKGM